MMSEVRCGECYRTNRSDAERSSSYVFMFASNMSTPRLMMIICIIHKCTSVLETNFQADLFTMLPICVHIHELNSTTDCPNNNFLGTSS